MGISVMGISLAIAPPSFAHQTETANDIGATLHIEPNDVPRAGEASLTWFAISRRGGEILPLAACDCTLTVYALPEGQVVQEPALESVSAEGYDSIPGTFVTFPEVGAYELVLQGQPTTPNDFTPFEFRFDVTVATGSSNSSSNPVPVDAGSEVETSQNTSTNNATNSTAEQAPAEQNQSPTPSNASAVNPIVAITGGVLLGAIALAGIGLTLKRQKRHPQPPPSNHHPN